MDGANELGGLAHRRESQRSLAPLGHIGTYCRGTNATSNTLAAHHECITAFYKQRTT